VGGDLRGRKSSNAELARKVLAHARFIQWRAAHDRGYFRSRNDRGSYVISARLTAPFFLPCFPPLADILLTFDRDPRWDTGHKTIRAENSAIRQKSSMDRHLIK